MSNAPSPPFESGPRRRRLRAVMAADVANFGGLVSVDETSTLEALWTTRRIAREQLAVHGGWLFGLPGDGIFALFESAVDAVRCALETQVRLAAAPGLDALRLRVGVHLGEVLFQDDLPFGEALVIAARLESLAEPGGILISSAVMEAVAPRISADFAERGVISLKHSPRRVATFSVAVPRADPRSADAGSHGRNGAAANDALDHTMAPARRGLGPGAEPAGPGESHRPPQPAAPDRLDAGTARAPERPADPPPVNRLPVADLAWLDLRAPAGADRPGDIAPPPDDSPPNRAAGALPDAPLSVSLEATHRTGNRAASDGAAEQSSAPSGPDAAAPPPRLPPPLPALPPMVAPIPPAGTARATQTPPAVATPLPSAAEPPPVVSLPVATPLVVPDLPPPSLGDTTMADGTMTSAVPIDLARAARLLPDDCVEDLVQALTLHIGPVARMLVRRHAGRIFDADLLVDTLAAEIPAAAERPQFLIKARRIVRRTRP